MDTIKLSKEIDNKIKKAKEYLPVLLDTMQQFNGLKITHRIKDKSRILEKLMLWSNNPKLQDFNEFELLDNIRDIIGITVVIDKLEDIFDTSNQIINQLQNHSIEFTNCIDHISDNGSITGYKCLLLTFDNKDNMPFEIQVTDAENLAIREATHDEFVQKKYASVKSQKDIEDNNKDLEL